MNLSLDSSLKEYKKEGKNQFGIGKKWIKKNRVVDVILFGSSVRGKTKARDIDLGILIKDEDEKRSIDLVDSLSKLTPNSHVNVLTLSNLIEGNILVKTLMQEGYSIKNRKNFSHLFGFSNKSLFIYSLKNFSPSKRAFQPLCSCKRGFSWIRYLNLSLHHPTSICTRDLA